MVALIKTISTRTNQHRERRWFTLWLSGSFWSKLRMLPSKVMTARYAPPSGVTTFWRVEELIALIMPI